MDYEKLWLESVQDFQEELDGRLDNILNLADKLPLNPMRRNSADINEIFRELHSIKGNANLLGLDLIKTTAHKLEDIIVSVRDRQEPFSDDKRAEFNEKTGLIRQMSLSLSKGLNIVETES